MTILGKIILAFFLAFNLTAIIAPYFVLNTIWASIGIFTFMYLYYAFLIWIIGEGQISYLSVLALPFILLREKITSKKP